MSIRVLMMALISICPLAGVAAAQDGDFGACCFGEFGCADMPEKICAQLGGKWQGAGSTCDDFPCGNQDWGACCVGDFGEPTCILASEATCAEYGGVFHGVGTPCADVSCDGGGDWGACCVGGDCYKATEEQCADYKGQWHDTGCDNVQCPAPCPGDVNGDGEVGVDDILIMLANWGPCI